MNAALSAKLFPRWRLPIDFYHTFNGRRIFGNHKTVRGILFGLTASVVVFAIERELFYSYVSIRSLSIVDYSHMTLAFGFALGVGGLGGDIARSFFRKPYLDCSLNISIRAKCGLCIATILERIGGSE